MVNVIFLLFCASITCLVLARHCDPPVNSNVFDVGEGLDYDADENEDDDDEPADTYGYDIVVEKQELRVVMKPNHVTYEPPIWSLSPRFPVYAEDYEEEKYEDEEKYSDDESKLFDMVDLLDNLSIGLEKVSKALSEAKIRQRAEQDCKEFEELNSRIKRAIESGDVYFLGEINAEIYDKYNGKCREYSIDHLDFIPNAAAKRHYDVAIMLSERGFSGISFTSLDLLSHPTLLEYAKSDMRNNYLNLRAVLYGSASHHNSDEFRNAVLAITRSMHVRDAVYAVTEHHFCHGARILMEECPIADCVSSMRISNTNEIPLIFANCLLKSM